MLLFDAERSPSDWSQYYRLSAGSLVLVLLLLNTFCTVECEESRCWLWIVFSAIGIMAGLAISASLNFFLEFNVC